MNIIFMRHGQATDNAKKIISDKEVYWSTLTKSGTKTILNSIKHISKNIDKIYVSPLPRTLETAHFVSKTFPQAEIIIEKRIREIDSGKYSGQKNNFELDNTRLKQINGDYFIRFGEYGENKFDIELRLCEFLKDIYQNNFNNNTIMIISHGSIISYMKRILKVKSPHIKTGEIEELTNIEFLPLFEHIKNLKKIKSKIINNDIHKIKSLNINIKLRTNLIRFIEKEFNKKECPNYFCSNFIDGLTTKKLKQITNPKFEPGIILICFYNNFENFAKRWINHYINIGIKNFVLINSNSTDKSTEILKNYEKIVHISFWENNETYNSYKMCGYKQYILEHYGIGNKYLIVDSNELFIYENYKNISIEEYIRQKKTSNIKSLALDVYNKQKINEGTIKDFKFVDKDTYKITESVPYKQQFYGGPKFRIFGIKKSLQKISLLLYTGSEVIVNNHYYYPWSINEKSKFASYLLDYKLISEGKKEYNPFINDERIWNNLHEYKADKNILGNNETSFYNEKVSIPIENIDFNFKI